MEGLKKKFDEPIASIVLCGKDGNGLNALHKVSSLDESPMNFFSTAKNRGEKSPFYLSRHKAAGLGYTDIAREILERCPATVAAQDNEGKTPLHYAAALKDDGVMYDLLTEHGADESKLDNVSTS